MRRLSIAVLTHLFPSDSTVLSGPWLAEQVDALSPFVDVNVLAALRECPAEDRVRASGVSVSYRPTRVIGGIGRAALLASAIRYRRVALTWLRNLPKRPDVIHAHFGFPDAVVGARAARILGIPFVITLHGDDAFSLIGRSDVVGRAIREAVGAAHTVICVSTPMAEAVRRYLPDATDMVVIPNGYDDTLFRIDPNRRREGILFVGTLTRVKNLDVLLGAIALVGGEHRLTIVGDGPLENELKARARSMGVWERVTFLPSASRGGVALHMQGARALVLASSSEGFGMVAAEALACGTPVVASNVGGLPGIVASQDSGVLVEPNSVEALAQGIERVLARTWDPQAVAAGSGARPWNERAQEIASVYDRVAAQRRRR